MSIIRATTTELNEVPGLLTDKPRFLKSQSVLARFSISAHQMLVNAALEWKIIKPSRGGGHFLSLDIPIQCRNSDQWSRVLASGPTKEDTIDAIGYDHDESGVRSVSQDHTPAKWGWANNSLTVVIVDRFASCGRPKINPVNTRVSADLATNCLSGAHNKTTLGNLSRRTSSSAKNKKKIVDSEL